MDYGHDTIETRPERLALLGVDPDEMLMLVSTNHWNKLLCEVSELRTELAKTTAELEALRGQVVTMAKRHAAEMNRTETELAHLRSDVSDWRDRHDAREAELRAIRGITGRSWWQRLLPGPAASPAWEEA